MEYPCPACGGEGKAVGDTPEGAEGEMARASAFVWATKGSSEERLRTKLAQLLAEARAEGVAQGRAAGYAREANDNPIVLAINRVQMEIGFIGKLIADNLYTPMSRRDEFAKAAMVGLIDSEAITEGSCTVEGIAVRAKHQADALLAALDGKEE